MSFDKNYKQCVHPYCSGVTYPEPTAEQLKTYQSDKIENIERKKRAIIRKQNLEVTYNSCQLQVGMGKSLRKSKLGCNKIYDEIQGSIFLYMPKKGQ